MLETFEQIGQNAARQATLILSQETFGMVDSVALLRVEEVADGDNTYFTLRWQALSMGVALCDVAMVLLPEFLDADEEGKTGLTDQAASYLVVHTIEKLREATEEDE